MYNVVLITEGDVLPGFVCKFTKRNIRLIEFQGSYHKTL